MNAPIYIKSWLNERKFLLWPALLFILLSGVVQFAAFALSQNYVISYFAAQPEDITLSLQLCYVGILCILPLQNRFLRYFELKYYFTFNIICGILLSAACIYTTDIHLFFVIRFLQGVFVCLVVTGSLFLFSGTIPLPYRQTVAPTFIYGAVLSGAPLIGIVASQVSLNSDFTNVYKYLILFLLTSLTIITFGLRSKSHQRRYPLYQIDWIGALLFLTFLAPLAYTIVYGSKYYWFSDSRIIISTSITITAAIVFLARELTVKRPMLNLSILLNPKFMVAMAALGLYYGIKETINLLFGYAGTILQWSSPQISALTLYNMAGVLIFIVVSAIIVIRYNDAIVYFLLTGFLLLLGYHIWVYFMLTPDLAFNQLIIPVFLQGAASGVLFVPIMVFALKSISPSDAFTGLTFGAFTRFFSLLNASAGFYNLQLYYNQMYKEGFLTYITPLDQQLTERLVSLQQLFRSKGFSADQAAAAAQASLARSLAIQDQLLTVRAVFLYISIIIAAILLLILLVMVVKVLNYPGLSRGKTDGQ